MQTYIIFSDDPEYNGLSIGIDGCSDTLSLFKKLGLDKDNHILVLNESICSFHDRMSFSTTWLKKIVVKLMDRLYRFVTNEERRTTLKGDYYVIE